MNENLEQPDLREHPETYATYGAPYDAQIHLQQLKQHNDELRAQLKECKEINLNANKAIGDMADECSRIQKEYDEFRRVALMLTTEESISFMRGKL